MSAGNPLLEEIRTARRRLERYLAPTPLIESSFLTQRIGTQTRLKLESLQPTGAFKVRPALNAILSHLEQARARGVVTSSSGNFAQATAWAAAQLDVRSRIVMMRSASELKRRRTIGFGGEVVDCDDTYEARWETTARLLTETGALPLHPYDAVETIAGDGTLGLELLDQVDQSFTVIVPVSGGGLISGIATAVKQLRPDCRVVGVQPELNPSMHRSLAAGERIQVEPGRSIADALTVALPGEKTFACVQEFVDEVVLVSEEEMAEAVGRLAVEDRLVIEPGGAAPVAALLAGKIVTADQPVVCVLSGGNISPALLANILGRLQ